MLAEFVEKLKGLVKESQSGVLPLPSGFPTGYYGVREPDGQINLRRIPNTPRTHRAFSFESFLDYLAAWYANKVPMSVWHANDDIVALLVDDNSPDGRRDTVAMKLGYTEDWKWLIAATKQPAVVSQQEFIRLLRTTLLDCVQNFDLLGFVRQLKWSRSTSGEANIQQGRESMGRAIDSQLTGADKIPEGFTAETKIFARMPLDVWKKWVVRVVIEIDFTNEKFILTPVIHEIEDAVQESLALMGDVIKKELQDRQATNIAVYAGSP